MAADLLLIDDSLTDCRLLMDMMDTRRMRVSVAFDGKKGYQQAVLRRPDLILLDVYMPQMDGFATCRHLKANPATRTIPVIFLTAATDIEERLKGFAIGAVDYIGKPFNEHEVLARIGVHMRLTPKTTDEAPPPDFAAGRDSVLVEAAQNALRERLADPPALDALARDLATNRNLLNAAFHACCGLTVFGWLREERLRQGYHLVADTDTPVSMIAEHLGYSSQGNFTKAFHDRFGVAPRDLRRDRNLSE